MRFIPTRFHGILDYLYGVLLIASPWLFGFAAGGAETWVAVVIGAIVLVQTVFTDFEMGLIKKIPMQSHLMMDFGIGVILAISPWIFGFADYVFTPHLIFGIFSILAALTTHRTPSRAYKTNVAGEETMR
jgi:hypothetical protein